MVCVSHLSTELHPTQPIPPHTFYQGAEWGNREKFLVDAEPRWREDGQGPPPASGLHGQQHQIPKKQRPHQR